MLKLQGTKQKHMNGYGCLHLAGTNFMYLFLNSEKHQKIQEEKSSEQVMSFSMVHRNGASVVPSSTLGLSFFVCINLGTAHFYVKLWP